MAIPEYRLAVRRARTAHLEKMNAKAPDPEAIAALVSRDHSVTPSHQSIDQPQSIALRELDGGEPGFDLDKHDALQLPVRAAVDDVLELVHPHVAIGGGQTVVP